MKKASLFLFWLFLTIPCAAEIIIVDANGTGDYPTIQAAINNANNGDIIELQPGTYTGNGNRDINYFGKAITVRSTDPNDSNIVAGTVIDCQSSGRGFYFHSSEGPDSILAGLTMTNGYADRGSGIYCSSSPTITNCILSSNSAGDNGGGIYCYYAGPTVSYCTIVGNSVDTSPTGISRGGGISCYYSNATISNCIIRGNSIDTSLAGTSRGGGISCYHGNATISNCIISGNSIYRSTAYGGGISCFYSNAIISNCIISGNSVRDPYSYGDAHGGGIHCDSGSVRIEHSTITANSAVHLVGGGVAGGVYSGNVNHCIVWFNTATVAPNLYAGSLVSYSDIQGGWPGETNIDADPCFVNRAAGDYHLSRYSPCINAGDPSYTPATTETDIDGEARVMYGRVDI